MVKTARESSVRSRILFVKHHGALGSFVRVHVHSKYRDQIEEMKDFCDGFDQVEVAMLKEEGAKFCETPIDREGDILVVSTKNAVIGSNARSMISERLRAIACDLMVASQSSRFRY